MKNLILLVCISSMTSCSKKINSDVLIPERIDRMYAFMQGSYTNKEQTKQEKDIDEVTMHIVPIWKNRTDERWLYLESYKKDDPTNQIKQRVIKLEESLDFLKQQIYSIPNHKEYVGAWRQEELFDSLDPGMLRKQKGCTIFFKESEKDHFKGITLGKNCVNRFRGSHYARTDMSIKQNSIRLQEQGFDDKSMYIWGAKNGGYFFYRIEDK